MTLGLWKRAIRNLVKAWPPLGYIPNLALLSKNENACRLDSKKKYAMYHEFLDMILASFDRLQKAGGIPFEFDYKGKHYKVQLKIFMFAVIGDTEGHDRMTGHYQNRQLKVKRICRHCNIPSDRLDDPTYPWQYTFPKEITDLMEAEDWDGLKAISQHPIKNAFYKLDCGGNERNIHGMSMGEILHMIDLGLPPRSLDQFYIGLGVTPRKRARQSC